MNSVPISPIYWNCDWNAVVGENPEDDCVENFGLGSRNERGQKLVEFCKKSG